MSRRSEATVSPRNGHTVVTAIVGRISGCQNQKELSLEDQVDHGKEVAQEHYDGSIEYRLITTTGKGEHLDRPELAKIEKMLRSRQLDLLVVEDIGRLIRGPAAHRLCGIAVDHGVRVLSPNDMIDTAEESWEQDVLDACKEHMQHNAHTSRRLKHKLMNRFKKMGAATPCPIAGYIKPAGAKTFADWIKDESVNKIIRAGASLLKRTLNGSLVADYFNKRGFKPGPYCRKKQWDGPMVLRFYRNPILKGKPCRGTKHTIKHNESGHRKAVRNPKGPVFRVEEHLAHLREQVFDGLNAALALENEVYRRTKDRDADPRSGVAKKRTRALGQHATCWYCGRHYVWGGNGVTDNLMCSGSREWKCWNSIGFHGPFAARQLATVIMERLNRVAGLDEDYRRLLQEAQNDGSSVEEQWSKLDRDEQCLAREFKNTLDAIAQFGPSPQLHERYLDAQRREKLIAADRHYLETASERALELPASPSDLRSLMLQEFQSLAASSYEFADLIRELVPEFHVYLVRLCDGGHLMPRAKVKLNLLGSFADAALVPGLEELLAEEFTIDLFPAPPQRERVREKSIALLQSQKLTHEQIANALDEQVTSTAVQRAIALNRRMLEMGLTSPYVLVESPPDDYNKLRRHKNHHYLFEPLEGYEPPEL